MAHLHQEQQQQQNHQQEPEDPDYCHDPTSRTHQRQVWVEHLKCPFEELPVPCPRPPFSNAHNNSNAEVRRDLWSHLVDDETRGGHGFGQYVCYYAECARTLPGRVYQSRRAFWAHIAVHRARDAEQLRLNPHFNTATYRCWFCRSVPFLASSQADVHVHIAKRHHPGRFHCTRPNCRYVSAEQQTVVAHYQNPRHR